MGDVTAGQGPHAGQPIATAGAPLHRAKAAVVMVHGRGANAEGMLSLAKVFAQPDLAYLAPQAAGRSWYPLPFLAPIERNEPYLSSALGVLDALLDQLAGAGFAPERVVLLGFSQGALPGAGVCGTPGTALRRPDWPERRPDRAGGDATGLRRRSGWHAGFPGLQ